MKDKNGLRRWPIVYRSYIDKGRTMHGRPKLGKHRMVTVATRIEPQEIERLKSLAGECQLSVCAYLRELIRMEIGRADRSSERSEDRPATGYNGDSPKLGLAV
ncbi:MAG: hypothetical protein ACR2QV_05050 [Gammaproteobacteria bacterium]